MRPTNIALRILVFGGLGVLLVWGFYGYIDLSFTRSEWGSIGDKFGALNTLFTGLAMVGVVAALWHEREQAMGRDLEHRELLDAMKAQASASLKAARIAAASERLTRLEAKVSQFHQNGTVPPGTYSRRGYLTALQGEIDTLNELIDQVIGSDGQKGSD